MLSISDPRFDMIIEKIDSANAQDPNKEELDGKPIAKELLYGTRMSAELTAFYPQASAHLAIATRAQHIERWKSPRGDFPEGRSGYKKWRSSLSLFHADRCAEIMSREGCDEEDINRVKYLIQKRQIKRNPETQILEDVICNVFLHHYFDEFAEKHSEEKIINILQKTWGKMSENGHARALTLPHSPSALRLIEKALES